MDQKAILTIGLNLSSLGPIDLLRGKCYVASPRAQFLEHPELNISAAFKILAFQNPQLTILIDFKSLAFQNDEFKILHDLKISVWQPKCNSRLFWREIAKQRQQKSQ